MRISWKVFCALFFLGLTIGCRVKVHHVSFSDDTWIYYVEADEGAVYVAGIQDRFREFASASEDQIFKVFEGETGHDKADLMIIAHGPILGDDNNDFYSPLYEVPRIGKEIKPEESANYYHILEVAKTKHLLVDF